MNDIFIEKKIEVQLNVDRMNEKKNVTHFCRSTVACYKMITLSERKFYKSDD